MDLIDDMRKALIEDDQVQAERLKRQLLAKTARALQIQDSDALHTLDAAFADLAPLADHYAQASPGELWHGLGRVIDAMLQAGLPIPLRAGLKGQRGKLLAMIQGDEGLRPKALAKRLAISEQNLGNLLKGLEDQGLILRLRRGSENSGTGSQAAVCVYLSDTGRALLRDDMQSPKISATHASGDSKVVNMDKYRHIPETRGQPSAEVPGFNPAEANC